MVFAEKHRLRLKRGECGDEFVHCKHEEIFNHEDGCFGVMILSDSGSDWSSTGKIWNSARRMMQAAGIRITEDGNEEGTELFDPTDDKQVKVAFKGAQPYRRKKLSEEHLARQRQNAKLSRSVRETLSSRAIQGQSSIASLGLGDSLSWGFGATLGVSRVFVRKSGKRRA